MRAFLLTAAALTGGPAVADWEVETGTDPDSYRPVATLARESNETIQDEFRRNEVRPRLEIRCTPGGDGTLGARIDWRRFISSFNTDVTFAAGDAEELTLSLGVDRSNEVTSTRNADDAARLADTLAGQDELAATVTPYSDVPVTVTWDLGGFAAGLDELREACSR